jgi:hypothetical protein
MANIQALYESGRAKSRTELWTAEENELVHLLVKQRGIQRQAAADYVRNGVASLEDYDKATKAKFVPTKLDDAVKAVTEGLKDNANAHKGKAKK